MQHIARILAYTARVRSVCDASSRGRVLPYTAEVKRRWDALRLESHTTTET